LISAEKKKWSTPRLTVFVRTKAEEMVLTGCKNNTTPTGTNVINSGCRYWTGYCVDCNVRTIS
jgi:hypothetical protein